MIKTIKKIFTYILLLLLCIPFFRHIEPTKQERVKVDLYYKNKEEQIESSATKQQSINPDKIEHLSEREIPLLYRANYMSSQSGTTFVINI